MEQNTHIESPVHQIDIHIASLYFRRPREICRGSGKLKTSSGRVLPSRGSNDSVSDKETAVLGGGGRGCGDLTDLFKAGLRRSAGGVPESAEDEDGTGEGDRRGDGWWASQPLLGSASDSA